MASKYFKATKLTIFAVVFAAFVGLACFTTSPAGAQGATPAPKGSYRTSCQGIEYRDEVLTALCDMGTTSGGTLLFSGLTDRNNAALVTKNCAPSSDIWNQFGELYCIAKLGVASQHAIPAGSYLQSCTAIAVSAGVLHANCATTGDATRDNSLKLTLCDLSEGIDNNDGQLLCTPATAQSTAKTQQAVATLTAPPPSPVQTALKGVGCSWFLGRANQYLCPTHAAFTRCVGYVAKGQVKSCMAPNEIHTDCRRFLGRANEYLCQSRPAFLQCQNYPAEQTVNSLRASEAFSRFFP